MIVKDSEEKYAIGPIVEYEEPRQMSKKSCIKVESN